MSLFDSSPEEAHVPPPMHIVVHGRGPSHTAISSTQLALLRSGLRAHLIQFFTMSTSEADSSRRTTFTRRLPKLELHAHLNGSIRRSTLLALASSHSIDPSHAQILTRWPSTLSEAFSVFSVIHSCVTTLSDVERIAFEVGEDLEADGVIYAEIRTTPRGMEGGGSEGYVEAVLRGFARYSAGEGTRVVLRLILSIDRSKHSAGDAMDIVQLAAKYRSEGVVGIDLSGDPTKGQFETFLPALHRARSVGLKITLHAGEVPHTNPEMSTMLDFNPDRPDTVASSPPQTSTASKRARYPSNCV